MELQLWCVQGKGHLQAHHPKEYQEQQEQEKMSMVKEEDGMDERLEEKSSLG